MTIDAWEEAARQEWLAEWRRRARQGYDCYAQTGMLTTELATTAQIERSRWEEDRHGDVPPALSLRECADVCAACDRLYVMAKVFEAAVWYGGGVQQPVRDSPHRGLSGCGDDWSVMVYTMAGRVLLTFRDHSTRQSVTLITADGEAPFSRFEGGGTGMGPMGVQSVECTARVGTDLLRRAIVVWPELRPDENVTIG